MLWWLHGAAEQHDAAPWNSSFCNDPPPEKQPRHAAWLANVGVAVAVCGSFICSLALLIGKRSADTESGWPLLLQWRWPPVVFRRKRWWVFFIINTGSDVLLSSLALSLAPLSQIAPCAGLAVIFSALLARFGCVPGVREQLSIVEWLALGVTLAGLVACSVFGPRGTHLLPFDEYGDAFASPALLSYTGFATLVVSGWLGLLVARPLRNCRPRPSSTVYPLLSSYGAGICGSFSVIFQKIFVRAMRSALVGSCGALIWSYWVTYLSLAGLAVCAPTQLYLLNIALGSGKASYTIPVYTVNNIANGIVVSGLLFHEFDGLAPRQGTLFAAALAAVLAGVALLSTLQGKRDSRRQHGGGLGSHAVDSILVDSSISINNSATSARRLSTLSLIDHDAESERSSDAVN